MSFPAPIVADRFVQFAKCPARFRQKLTYTGFARFDDTFINFYRHPTLGHYRSTDLLMTEQPVYRFNKETGLLGHNLNGLLRVNQICKKFDDDYKEKKKVDPMTCRSTIDARHYFYQVANEFSIRLNFNPTVPLDKFEEISNTPNEVAAIGALTSEDAVYPGPGFANENEYEFYVALQTRGRTQEAITYAAGIPGAYVHNPRDPFIYGHCYLLLYKREQWINIYQRGANYLTKDFFEANWNHLDRDKVVLYLYRPGNGDAHLTLHSSIPGAATGVYTTVGQIADKLRVAFDDGVVDDETLQWIYASVVPSRKRPGIA